MTVAWSFTHTSTAKPNVELILSNSMHTLTAAQNGDLGKFVTLS